MNTIRGRLAVSYAVAMVATLGIFAATIYYVERPTSSRGGPGLRPRAGSGW
ncbi:MAG: hypothetical protein P8X82_17910 [Gemmatimonadales bacterium]